MMPACVCQSYHIDNSSPGNYCNMAVNLACLTISELLCLMAPDPHSKLMSRQNFDCSIRPREAASAN